MNKFNSLIIKKLLFLGMLVHCLSCTKDNSIENEIIFKKLSPPIEFSTVRAYESGLPIPTDSSIVFQFDIDGDFISDFKFQLRHYRYILPIDYSCGLHSSVYYYTLSIEPIGSNCHVATAGIRTIQFDSLDIISNNLEWNDSLSYIMHYAEPGCIGWDFNLSDSYIGIKLNEKIGWIHVERISKNGFAINNGIAITDYAINTIDKLQITAGRFD